MKRLIRLAIFCVGGALTMQAAEERFSKAVRPEDFSAAGLAKLSAAEIERLDALVREFKARADETGASVAIPASGAVTAERARATEGPTREGQAAKKSEGGLLARAKVILTPGTEIEYSTIESRIVGEFRGWQPKTVFTLENGQRWQVAGGAGYVGSPVSNPKIKIAPGALGTFWMYIEGVNQRVKVTLVGGG